MFFVFAASTPQRPSRPATVKRSLETETPEHAVPPKRSRRKTRKLGTFVSVAFSHNS